MTMGMGKTTGWLGLAALALASWGCENGTGVFVMSQMHQVTDSGDAPAGSGCGELESGSSMGMGDITNDFWMTEDGSRSGLHVRIGSEDEVLVDRHYDLDFLESREVDRFVVTTHSGDEYSFMYWGGDTCEQCPPIEFEPLPGDPWGCGTPSSARTD